MCPQKISAIPEAASFSDIYKLKQSNSDFYKTIGFLWCPAVKDTVVFNNHGWIHIRYNSKGKRRQSLDIAMRFKLLQYVPEVIKNAKLVLKKTEGMITSRKGIIRKVKYYELAGKVDNGKKHVTVILRRIEKGKLHYYSVRRTSSKIKKALSGLH